MKANRNSASTSAIFILLVVSSPAFGCKLEGALGKVADRVFREFEHISSIAAADEYLHKSRPCCIPPSLRAKLIARLPYEGGVELTAQARLKLAAIDSVLEYHERKGIFGVKVIHVVQAFIGLHARTVLLISERALELLTAEELRAAVAHEIGHEYFWSDYQAAARSGDPVKLQEQELRCDAVAVLTLLRLSADPAALLAGVSKQEGFNELVGATANTNCYVSMKERTRFVRALTDRVMTGSERPIMDLLAVSAQSDTQDARNPIASSASAFHTDRLSPRQLRLWNDFSSLNSAENDAISLTSLMVRCLISYGWIRPVVLDCGWDFWIVGQDFS